MRKAPAALSLILLMLIGCPLFAQQRQVQVRLFSSQLPSSIRIVPQGNASVNGAALKSAATISAAGGRIAIDGKPAADRSVRITGTFRVETTGNTPVRLQQTLDVSLDGNQLRLLITEPLEEYVAAVLAGEAGNFQSAESLKAMAVAIRTFAVRFEGRHRPEGFDFCDTTHCQDFRMTAITDRLRSAVESTEGELLWFNGRPAATYYHQDCGGQTEDAGSVWPDSRAPYLRSLQDPFCIAKGRKDWATDLTVEELHQVTGATAVQVASRTEAGRVRQLRLAGAKIAIVSAEQFRLAIGRAFGWDRLRSDDYEVRRVGDKFRFQGHGAGHGVGLCQAGAAQMGVSGKNYREILAFYYPGTKLGITAQGLTWTRSGGERVDLQSTHPDTDRRIIAIGDRLVRQVETAMGQRLQGRPAIRVFPSVAVYRDSTGEPGWVAASTRGTTVRLQPLETLGADLERTLHHELMHVMIEQRAAPNLPRWFREGLVLVLTESGASSPRSVTRNRADIDRALLRPKTREEFFQAYADAKGLVAQLIAKYGKQTVLGWVATGLPAGVISSAA